MQSIYGDDKLVGAITRDLVERGETVFQIHRLAESEDEHVARLLDFFNLPQGAAVLDLACGIGAVVKRMKELRPDLNFTLQNISAEQLSLCPPGITQIRCDFRDLPDVQADVVMVQYALGHAESPYEVFASCAKVLRPGGLLCVYDLVTNGSADALRETLWYDAWHPEVLKIMAHDAGFRLDDAQRPDKVYTAHTFDEMDPATFAKVFADVYPMLFRFVRI
jgi:ubiquinone/menaquinone biosynthesis C-methylase UbiE